MGHEKAKSATAENPRLFAHHELIFDPFEFILTPTVLFKRLLFIFSLTMFYMKQSIVQREMYFAFGHIYFASNFFNSELQYAHLDCYD